MISSDIVFALPDGKMFMVANNRSLIYDVEGEHRDDPPGHPEQRLRDEPDRRFCAPSTPLPSRLHP